MRFDRLRTDLMGADTAFLGFRPRTLLTAAAWAVLFQLNLGINFNRLWVKRQDWTEWPREGMEGLNVGEKNKGKGPHPLPRECWNRGHGAGWVFCSLLCCDRAAVPLRKRQCHAELTAT